jgi:hypothetical protein
LQANARRKADSGPRDEVARQRRYQMLRAAGVPAPMAKRLKDIRPDRWPLIGLQLQEAA